MRSFLLLTCLVSACIPHASAQTPGASFVPNTNFGPTTRDSSTGLPTTFNCNASWNAWLGSSVTFSFGKTATLLTTYEYYNMTAQVTTLCDGHPRIVGGVDGLTTTATGTTTVTTIQLLNITAPFLKPTPTCLPPLTDRSGLSRSWDVWVPQTTPTFVNLATVSGCGPCSIFGGHVQLLYFPVGVHTTKTLCPANGDTHSTLCPLAPTIHPYTVSNPFDFSPCDYATPNLTSTTNSGPYIISNGHTFYRDRAYVSLHTAYAMNACGYVGKQFSQTILTLRSSDAYTVDGYHHQFQDIGYSVDYANFQTVPADVYYQGCDVTDAGLSATYCSYTGGRYRYNTDFINGINTIDFGNVFQPVTVSNQWIWDEAYAPTLLVPLQMRQLDSAWSTCSLNLNGLYDPPQQLSQQLIYPTPTAPGPAYTPTPTPAQTPSAGPVETARSTTIEAHPASPAPSQILSKTVEKPQPSPNTDASTKLPDEEPGPGSGISQHLPTTSVVASIASPASDTGSSQSFPETDPAATSPSSALNALPPIVSNSDASPLSTSLSPSHSFQAVAIATLTINQQTHLVSAVPNLYAIDGSYTVSAGEPAIIVDGVPVTIAPESPGPSSGGYAMVIVESQTVVLAVDGLEGTATAPTLSQSTALFSSASSSGVTASSGAKSGTAHLVRSLVSIGTWAVIISLIMHR